MGTADSLVRGWRQLKRVLSTVVFVAGAYVGWLLYIGDLKGPVMLFIGALLAGLGLVGMVFPSKVRVLNTRSHPD